MTQVDSLLGNTISIQNKKVTISKMNTRHMSSKWQCTRCSKNYQYKGGLAAHIKRKHPISEEPKKNNQTAKKKSPVPVAPLIVHDLISINTQELEGLLEDEQEYFEAVEVFEHDVGINDSMIDWFNVNFQSSFSNTKEFDNRLAVVVKPINCEDCKVSSATFEKQRALLLKQDKQIQDCKRTEKENKDEVNKFKILSKNLESRNEETTQMLETVLEESNAEIKNLNALLKNKGILQSKVSIESTGGLSRNEKEVECTLEKCKVCEFASKSKVVMKQHMEYKHKGVKAFKCLMCPVVSNSQQSFKEHKAHHQKELDVITRRDKTHDLEYSCEVCNKTYKNIEDAKAHAMKPCGRIYKKGDATNGKEPNQNSKCNYCKLLYSGNAALERHIKEKHHDGDCPKCNAIFKTEEDVLKHASVCSEIIEPHICTKCNCELINKSGLEKHIKRCEGKQDKKDTRTNDEICTNGQPCKYLKADRCRYTHI